MKIKNIRTFREFYKTNIIESNESNRNPHFAGDEMNGQGREFGFFHMFNGHGDIENKLSTILNIAGDSQAIYEFMQNAVDANSRNFILSKYEYDKNNYLVVINDGDYFDLQSVISILAIGASSKYRNPDNIGQFGVGFKLAHRLIGPDNSLTELLEENKGPILFSWANNEIKELQNIENVIAENPELVGYGKDAESKNNLPWLFKIIATNFPCMPNDSVLDVKGRQSDSLFSEFDLKLLKNIAKVSIEKYNDAFNFKTGTILIIPLYEKKVKHILGEIPKGLEIASTIISRRAKKSHDLRVQIEDKDLLPEEILSERWELKREITEGKLGNEKEKSVELMFLYSDYKKSNPFEGKPQFYRYFPMALEQHGFRFAIHCNALTLSAARTELIENDSNKFLFKQLASLLDHKIKSYSTENFTSFERLYVSVLLSNPSSNGSWIEGRQWLESALWQPLIQVLKNNIPTLKAGKFSLLSDSNSIRIKNSKLPIEDWLIMENFNWFEWNEKKNFEICWAAKSKLSLKSVNILDVINNESCFTEVNKWLALAPQNANDFLNELNYSISESPDRKLTIRKIFKLKLWWFSGNVYSIDELSSNQDLKYHLLNYGPINEIKNIIQKVNLIVSDNYIDEYTSISLSIREVAQGQLPYLYSYEELNKLISSKIIENNNLVVSERRQVFAAIETAVKSNSPNTARRIEIMKHLALFSNKRGEIKPLHQLTSLTNLPTLLQDWQINESELENVNVSDYLSNFKQSIYKNIILPFWSNIVEQEKQKPEDRVTLFEYVKSCYIEMPSSGMPPTEYIYFTNEGLNSTPFFHPSLINLTISDYTELASLLNNLGYNLPQQSLLRFYNMQPFLVPVISAVNLGDTERELNSDKLVILLVWLTNSFPEVIKSYLYKESDESENIKMFPIRGEIQNYFSRVNEVNDYVSLNLKNKLFPLPEKLQNLIQGNFLQGDKLLKYLINQFDENQSSSNELMKIILQHGNDSIKFDFLNSLTPFNLESQINTDSREYYILKVCFSINNDQDRIQALGKLCYLDINNENILLSKITSRGSDTLTIYHSVAGNLHFSVNELIGGESNQINQRLTKIAEYWDSIELSTVEQITSTLGILEHRSKRDVYLSMINNLQDSKIENTQQLVFIWVMWDEMQQVRVQFQIETLAGWKNLNGPFYINEFDFINKEICLSSRYDKNYFLRFNNCKLIHTLTWELYRSPYFNLNFWDMPGVNQIEGNNLQNSLFKFLYNSWLSANCPVSVKLLSTNQSWENLIGFAPNKCIIPSDYSLEEELLPYEKLSQIEVSDDTVNSFMIALGASSLYSTIVQLRKYFNNDGGRLDYGIDNYAVVRTLRWLSINDIAIKSEHIRLFYTNLARQPQELNYLPAYVPNENGMKIIDISIKVVQYIAKEDLKKAIDEFGLHPNTIANLVNIPIINLGILEDWVSYITNRVRKVEISWDNIDWGKLESEKVEWQYPFYIEWKNRYPNFYVFNISGGLIPRLIMINDIEVKSYRKGNELISQDRTELYFGGGDIETYINKLDQFFSFELQARVHLKNCFIVQNQQFQKFMDLAKTDIDFAKLLSERAETIRLKEERSAKAKVVNDASSHYTVSWFLNLLDMVRAQEKSSNIPEATFYKCERILNAENIFELSDCDGRIPSNIETFDSIPADISYINNYNDEIIVKTKLVASEKHQKLWVMFPELAVQEALMKTNKIKSIKLTFTRTVDLIDELKNGFKRLNLQDNINLKDTLSKNVDFIFGPPGTGKTTLLASQIISHQNAGYIGPRIVLTPTNKAADVLTKKIIELEGGNAPNWLIRAGTCTDPELLRSGVVMNGDDYYIAANTNNVLITTIHRFSYFTVSINNFSTDKSRLCDCPWKELIFDEASMIPLAYIVHAIQVRQLATPDTLFTVAGDPLQIPPVFELDNEDIEEIADKLQELNIYKMVGLTTFNETLQKNIPIYGNRIQNLKIQHRSIPAIGNIFSHFQYNGIIESSRGTVSNKKTGLSKCLPPVFDKLGIKPVTIIRYPVKSADSIYKPNKLNGSPIHLYSALLVSELTKLFRINTTKNNEQKWSIGVLSPYRSQADLMLKMIEAQAMKPTNVSITVDTVHGFQGDENDIIFAVFNPSGYGGDINCSRFLKKEYILNVAISRAEDYLIMFIPDDNSKGYGGLNLIHDLVRIANQTDTNLLAVIEASELEKRLKGQSDYFESHTFSAAHQKVNVYGKPELPFMIRMNNNSLDIHWDELG